MKAKGMVLSAALAALLVVVWMVLFHAGFRQPEEDGGRVAD